jgi:hypothetical protein
MAKRERTMLRYRFRVDVYADPAKGEDIANAADLSIRLSEVVEDAFSLDVRHEQLGVVTTAKLPVASAALPVQPRKPPVEQSELPEPDIEIREGP